MNNEITSQDVSAWMREQLAKAHELNDYASLTVRLSAYTGQEHNGPVFSVYLSTGHQWECRTMEDCFRHLEANPPKSQLEIISEEIRDLFAKRDALLAAEAAKNQPVLAL